MVATKESVLILVDVLNDVFNPRAEEHSSLATQLYFAGKQGNLVTELKRHAHHLIQGRMGTGKTMVLKFLSVSCQLYAHANASDLKFLGVYIGLSPAWLHPMKIDDDDSIERSQLFEAWLCLFAIESVIRELQHLPESSRAKFCTATTYGALAALLDLAESTSEDALVAAAEDERTDIQEYFRSSSFGAEKLTNLLERNKRRTLRPFFDRLARTLSSIFESIAHTSARVFFLLDQFEQCSIRQQAIISQLLATAGSYSPFFLKIGCRPNRAISIPGVAPQDFRVVQLEMPPDSDEFSRFAREVINLRFEAVSAQLRASGLTDEHIVPFGSVEALLGNYTFENQWREQSSKLKSSPYIKPVQGSPEATAFRAIIANRLPKRFGGLPTIRRLSGGFVRSLLGFTYQILRVAFEFENNARKVIRYRKIHLDIQDRAIRAEVQNELGARLRAILSSNIADAPTSRFSEARKEQIDALLRRLVRAFHRELVIQKSDPAILRFRLPFNPADSEYAALFEVLQTLRDLGYLTGEFSSDHPIFTLSPIVSTWLEADQLEIPPVAIGVLELSSKEALQLAKPFLPPTKPSRRRMQAFYASGWRSPSEKELLKLLSSNDGTFRDLTPETDLVFTVGSDPTGANHVLFEQLSELIKSSNYLVAEVSSRNENVAFEIGLARAYRKRTYHLLTQQARDIAPIRQQSARFEDFIRGHQFFVYNVGSQGDVDIETLRIALTKIAKHHQAKNQQPRRKVNMILQESSKYNVVPYFHAEERAPSSVWTSELMGMIRRLKKEPLTPVAPDRRRSQFDHFADAIDRSTHVIVDISHKDPFACMLYGYAIGTDRQVLAVWHRESGGSITDIRGLPGGGEYNNKDHLLEGIIKPWLMGEDV